MRRVAIGDPQAPFGKVLTILERHGLLGRDNRLAPDVFLVSIGDHFDWGHKTTTREQATRESRQLLEWLSAHSPEQVVLIAGNHDLARVGELLPFSDDQWQAIIAEADAVAATGGEADFLRRHPEINSAQAAYRDFATFDVAQRDLVKHLLRTRRYQVAYAPREDLLLTHAGVTIDDLAAVGAASARSAPEIAAALNAAFDAAFDAWDSVTPFEIPGLHHPGNALYGEARGMLFHRPANPEVEQNPQKFAGPLRRRFDPRRLVPGVMQGIGHIRDNKCRDLLGPWATPEPALDGPLRSMVVRGEDVTYARGIELLRSPEEAVMLFLDGGMMHAEVERYELLDIDRLRPLTP